jgi:hypothetical protein
MDDTTQGKDRVKATTEKEDVFDNLSGLVKAQDGG